MFVREADDDTPEDTAELLCTKRGDTVKIVKSILIGCFSKGVISNYLDKNYLVTE